MTDDDKAAIYAMQKRISDLLSGQASLQQRIAVLEVDKRRLERERDELRAAVAALLAPTPVKDSVVTDDPLRPYGR